MSYSFLMFNTPAPRDLVPPLEFQYADTAYYYNSFTGETFKVVNGDWLKIDIPQAIVQEEGTSMFLPFSLYYLSYIHQSFVSSNHSIIEMERRARLMHLFGLREEDLPPSLRLLPREGV